MAITIKPEFNLAEVNIEIEQRYADLLKRIKTNCSLLDAVMALRFAFPACGLIQAKKFIESL